MIAVISELTIESRYLWAAAILVTGLFGGYVVGRLNRSILLGVGIDEAVEGTSLERTTRNFGTDIVTVLAQGSAWLIVVFALVYSLEVAGVLETSDLLSRGAEILPSYVLAALVIMGGLLVADKLQLVVDERLKGLKFPEITIVSRIIRYTVIFVAILLALAQIGVAVGVLVLLFGAYLFGIIVLVAIALHQLLAAGGAGLYLLFNQPYSIGDRIEIGDREGVVQEVDLFTTIVDKNGRSHVVPNHVVLAKGVTLIRE
ncbi:MAG: mechanosensitive ion channel domain-containing protein [Halodesulfurarchaeum sp.]